MIISRYFVMFVLYSIVGWIYETTYCMIKSKKWENRGFLYGPICPIYGVGATSITIVAELLKINQVTADFKWWHVFIIAFVGSAILEYFTSWILEVRFHAYWWDYSDMPLNINGRICAPASFGFGVAGIIVVYVLAPRTDGLINSIPSIPLELMSMVFLSVLVADLTLTVSELTHFERMVISLEESVDKKMDQLVNTVNEKKISGVILDGSRVAAEKIKDTLDTEGFAKDKMEFLIGSMERSTRLAVERIRGFKDNKISIGHRKKPSFKSMERFRTELKKYQEKIKNLR